MSATVCTSQFTSLIKATAQAKGFPDLAIVSVSHPVGGIAVDEIRKKADDAVEEMIKIVTVPPVRLSEKS